MADTDHDDATLMIEAGLLGPDATSITYKTPSGQLKTERTVGGVGAYLIVFRQTASNCHDFGGGAGCGNGAFGEAALHGYTSVERITYRNGRACSDVPWGRTCAPVGWVNPKGPKLTTRDVATPITVNVVKAKSYCTSGPAARLPVIACDGKVPRGYTRFDPGGGGPQVLVTVSFVARQPVTSDNSWYEWILNDPRSGQGSIGQGNSTQANVRRGQRITFTAFVDDKRGVYHGTIGYVQNAGQNGSNASRLFFHHTGGGIVVGRFHFRLPLKH